MTNYRIYAGLGGSFGGANPHGIYEFETLDEAEAYAYGLAVEEYESYAGANGLLSWDECKEDLIESFPDEEWTDAEVNEHYLEEVESWITYWAEEVN